MSTRGLILPLCAAHVEHQATQAWHRGVRSLHWHAQSMTEIAMSDPVEPLILDLLEWIGPGPRPYAEVLEAWRTSCPRLPVWEEANERGFIVRHFAPGRETVAVTALGAEHVRTHRHVGVAM